MRLDKIMKFLNGTDNLVLIRNVLSKLRFETRFNFLREMIYHIDICLAEGYFEGADTFLKAAEKIALYIDAGQETKVPQKVRSLKIITKKKRARYFEYSGDFRSAIRQYHKIIESLKLPEESTFLAEMLMEIGILEEKLGRNKTALKHFRKAFRICSANEDTFNYDAAIFNCAHVYYDMSNYPKAEKYCRAVIKNNKKKTIVQSPIAHAYLEMANIHELFNRDDKAQKYYGKALETYRKLGEKVKVSDILNRLGVYEMNADNNIRALPIFEESLEIKQNIDYFQGKGYFLETMGDQLRFGKNPEEALYYYNLAYYFNAEAGSTGRNIIIKHKIFKILEELGLTIKDLGTFIETFRKRLPNFSEVVDVVKLDYSEKGSDGGKYETIREWKMSHNFRVSRKFLFYVVRNLNRLYRQMNREKDHKRFSRLQDTVEKKFRKKEESS
jgi:tetratricopeptide (TPR) repeat protein